MAIGGRGFPRRFILAAALGAASSLAQQPANPDLSQASLEDLMNIQVTSVSKKEQQLSKTGAAIFVITQEDIRRSGATNIPDLLRLAPGVDVARIDANQWAISIRGFNDQYANKVLVLIDGRSVYNPTFSGVYWNMQDVPLEDIERIEIIRGPGGTVWGANAVNGVINIITKSAKTTQGGLISAGTGTQDHADGLVQYGGSIGDGNYRVFGRYFNTANSVFPDNRPAADGWQGGHAGFRSDWNLSANDTLTVQGDFLKTNEGQTITTLFSNALPLTETRNDSLTATGANVLGRWDHTLASGSQMSLQVYYDYSRHLALGFTDAENTVDLDFQHHLRLGRRNDLVWGLGARVVDSKYDAGYSFTILPQHRYDYLFSGFLQDELKLASSVSLTIGSKLEHNDLTGFELEPSAQFVWTPSKNQAIWISAARAIRETSTFEVGLREDFQAVPLGPTFGIVEIFGDPSTKTEGLLDFEAGYRVLTNQRLSLDVAAFGSLYNNLEEVVPRTPYSAVQDGVPYMVLPEQLMNDPRARTYGVEFSANWSLTNHWRLSPGYSYLHIDIDQDVAHLYTPPGTSPNHQFQVKSLLDLPHHLEWDNTLGYVSKLEVGNVPQYARLDSRLGWRWGEFVELSAVGQNLLTPRHLEFSDPAYPLNPTLTERSVFGKLTWRF